MYVYFFLASSIEFKRLINSSVWGDLEREIHLQDLDSGFNATCTLPYISCGVSNDRYSLRLAIVDGVAFEGGVGGGGGERSLKWWSVPLGRLLPASQHQPCTLTMFFGRSREEPEKQTRIGSARTPEAPEPADNSEEEYGLFELWPDRPPGEATQVPTVMEFVLPSQSLATYTNEGEQHCCRSRARGASVQNVD